MSDLWRMDNSKRNQSRTKQQPQTPNPMRQLAQIHHTGDSNCFRNTHTSEAKSCSSWWLALIAKSAGQAFASKLHTPTGAAAKAGASKLMTTLRLRCA
jgi:hypothetical protein